jgi:excisionase family DNA binding protein
MTPVTGHRPLFERLVNAQEAAHCLNVPVYLLTHPEERARRGIPHYRVGKLVRFKLQELMRWIESQQMLHSGALKGGTDA